MNRIDSKQSLESERVGRYQDYSKTYLVSQQPPQNEHKRQGLDQKQIKMYHNFEKLVIGYFEHFLLSRTEVINDDTVEKKP